MKLAFAIGNAYVVDAGLPPAHQTLFVKLPELVAVGAKPLPCSIAILVLKPHGDAIVRETPERLRKPIVQFLFPFRCQEITNLLATGDKEVAVSPLRIF